VEAATGTLVWLADIAHLPDARLADFARWLSASERERHARFVREERRRQFLAGRALLRMALGRLLGMAPDRVVLAERPGQAPALADPPDARIGFSISHSGPLVACAASTVTRVGLDVERIDPARDVLALAGQAFPRADLARLRACGGNARTALFYRLWCLHEARLKLACDSGAEYSFGHDGVEGALCCERPLAAAPTPLLVDLAA